MFLSWLDTLAESLGISPSLLPIVIASLLVLLVVSFSTLGTSDQHDETSASSEHKARKVMDSLADIEDLVTKYDQPAPRYTSYPSVPFWNRGSCAEVAADVPGKQQPAAPGSPQPALLTPLAGETWLGLVKETYQATKDSMGIALYIHLPYCEQLCHYCACTKVITKYHDKVEGPYVEAVEHEWDIYVKALADQSTGTGPVLRELHLGGGTPTYFSPENLRRLVGSVLAKSTLHPDGYEFSFEAHPNSTTLEHLKVLYDLGFRKLSLGIQDFDEEVQKVVNRVQTYETVEQVVRWARGLGYKCISFDLIYGLPKQTLSSISKTIDQVNRLQPDRIAYYSYAHVPWVNAQQRNFSEKDLPSKTDKRALYELGKTMLTERGYFDVGMDHFARKDDALWKAKLNGKLHRNFMGYVSNRTQLLLGLGMSAISDSGSAYAQNVKDIRQYSKLVEQGVLPILKGHIMTEEDKLIKESILSLACSGKLTLSDALLDVMPEDFEREMRQFANEGIIRFSGSPVSVASTTPTNGIVIHRKATQDSGKLDAGVARQTPTRVVVSFPGREVLLDDTIGTMFLRNVCMSLDNNMRSKDGKPPLARFSKAI